MEDIMKKEESVRIHSQKSDWGIGSSYPSEPILTSNVSAVNPSVVVTKKVEGFISIFGEHYLCQLGCKRFVDKSLDKVIKFIEKEVRNYYEPKHIKKKGKGVEVHSHIRKPRKKKIDTSKHSEILKKHYEQDATEIRLSDDHEEHIKANIKAAEKLGYKKPTKKQMDKILNEHMAAMKPKKTKVEKNKVAIADGVEVDDAGQWKKKGDYMYPVRTK